MSDSQTNVLHNNLDFIIQLWNHKSLNIMNEWMNEWMVEAIIYYGSWKNVSSNFDISFHISMLIISPSLELLDCVLRTFWPWSMLAFVPIPRFNWKIWTLLRPKHCRTLLNDPQLAQKCQCLFLVLGSTFGEI